MRGTEREKERERSMGSLKNIPLPSLEPAKLVILVGITLDFLHSRVAMAGGGPLMLNHLGL